MKPYAFAFVVALASGVVAASLSTACGGSSGGGSSSSGGGSSGGSSGSSGSSSGALSDSGSSSGGESGSSSGSTLDGGGSCPLPDGTYKVTYTLLADASASCKAPTATTLTLPSTMPNDAGLPKGCKCSTDHFLCESRTTSGTDSVTTKSDVVQTKEGFAGDESVITTTADGGVVPPECEYHVSGDKQ